MPACMLYGHWLRDGRSLRVIIIMQAVTSAQLSMDGWRDNTVESRAYAIEAAKDASESAQLCHKFMRTMTVKA